jgi:hypothetical protein
MLENTTYYDVTYNIMGVPSIETTITKIFLSLQSQVLNSFLWSQLFFLAVVLLTIECLRGQGCSWSNFNDPNTPKQDKLIKITTALCYISLPLAIYGVFLCISVKWELNL